MTERYWNVGSKHRYGAQFRWFAWHPVKTQDRGWRWLRLVWRCRHVITSDPEGLFERITYDEFENRVVKFNDYKVTL